MKKLPVAIADFAKIRPGDYLYTDKTKFLYELVKNPIPFFLSRPRRFGKTLLASTLEALLRGRRELFKGLWIDGSDYDWRPRPVISLSLTGINTKSVETVEIGLHAALVQAAIANDLKIIENDPIAAFRLFIIDLYQKYDTKKGDNIDR